MKQISPLKLLTMTAFVASFALKAQTQPVADAQGFEIIDGNAEVSGDPAPLKDAAREKWKKACDEWKKETKELNKQNMLLNISCNTPDCATQDNGTYACTSTAVYKLKTAGQLAPPPPAVAEPAPQEVVQTAPPPVIVEAAPAPRPGFVWVVGYWGWFGGRHLWYPGRWITARPGFVWVGHRWTHRSVGWHFNVGHWRRR